MVRKPTKRIGSPRRKMIEMGITKQPTVRELTINGVDMDIVTRAVGGGIKIVG